MAFLGQTFDANTVNPNSQFDPLPAGEYPAIIIDSELKPTKNGTGQYLELVYQVIDGPFKGRQIWSRLNLVNANPQTVTIAQQHLSAICHACGVLQVTDSQQLHNIAHVIRVEFQPADGKNRQRDQNEIRTWKRMEGVTQRPVAPAHATPTPTPAAATAAPAAAPPWARPPGA